MHLIPRDSVTTSISTSRMGCLALEMEASGWCHFLQHTPHTCLQKLRRTFPSWLSSRRSAKLKAIFLQQRHGLNLCPCWMEPWATEASVDWNPRCNPHYAIPCCRRTYMHRGLAWFHNFGFSVPFVLLQVELHGIHDVDCIEDVGQGFEIDLSPVNSFSGVFRQITPTRMSESNHSVNKQLFNAGVAKQRWHCLLEDCLLVEVRLHIFIYRCCNLLYFCCLFCFMACR